MENLEILKKDEIQLGMIDDQEQLLDLSKIVLEKEKDNFDIDITTNPEEILDWYQDGELDVIVSDYDMPQMNGVELLKEVRKHSECFPFILYTGKGSEEIAAESIQAGVTDYIQKETGNEHYKFLANRIENSVESYQHKIENLILSEVVEGSDNMIMVTDTDSEIIYVNPAFENAFEYTEKELMGEKPSILQAQNKGANEFQQMYEDLLDGEEHYMKNVENISKTGETVTHSQKFIPISLDNGNIEYFASISDLEN